MGLGVGRNLYRAIPWRPFRAQHVAVILIVIKFGQRTGVFIKARRAALARPVELMLARAEAPAWACELELAQGLGLPCTPKKSQAGRS